MTRNLDMFERDISKAINTRGSHWPRYNYNEGYIPLLADDISSKTLYDHSDSDTLPTIIKQKVRILVHRTRQESSSSIYYDYVRVLCTASAAHFRTLNVLQALRAGFTPDDGRASYGSDDHLIVAAACLGLTSTFNTLFLGDSYEHPSSS